MEKENQTKRLFEDHVNLTLEQVSEVINQYIKEHMEELANVQTLAKWGEIISVFTTTTELQQKFLKEAILTDELLIPASEKIALLNTLSYSIVHAKDLIRDLDENSAFILIDYLKDQNLDDYDKIYQIFDNELLMAIRKNTLDREKRVMLEKYIFDMSQKEKLDATSLKNFHERLIGLLKEKTADEILGIENYMNGKDYQEIDFRDTLS